MKGNRGVTLTSLIVYIIGMLIMLATLATLRTFFSKNVDIRAINDDTIQYSKFASAFSTETNTKDNKVIECRTQIDEKGDAFLTRKRQLFNFWRVNQRNALSHVQNDVSIDIRIDFKLQISFSVNPSNRIPFVFPIVR
mgnify:CR=1 FL=1